MDIGSNVGLSINLTKKSEDHEEFKGIVVEALQLCGGFELSDLFPSFNLLNVISPVRPKMERLQKRAKDNGEYHQGA
ncbi:hypothetical protein TIFTF001_035373 [Ficus carica]|uniref:Uncharacterized protein n=1 Tax=Ficus carica TaxID=3494 RepID=A0AA88E5I2_FICCA|nr:hypothetical protein TIFTF001_035373 [Ficus carica]